MEEGGAESTPSSPPPHHHLHPIITSMPLLQEAAVAWQGVTQGGELMEGGVSSVGKQLG